jgi:uncharacterized membrane protein YidH (DUF202 family)
VGGATPPKCKTECGSTSQLVQAMAFWWWQRRSRRLETRAEAPPMNIPKIALLVVIGIMILVASFYLSLTILTLLD